MSRPHILIIVDVPETMHVDPPHTYHGRSICLIDHIAVAQVQQTIPRQCYGILTDVVWPSMSVTTLTRTVPGTI